MPQPIDSALANEKRLMRQKVFREFWRRNAGESELSDISRAVMESPTIIGDSTQNGRYGRKRSRNMPKPISGTIQRHSFGKRGRKAAIPVSKEWLFPTVGFSASIAEDAAKLLQKGVKLEHVIKPQMSEKAKKEYASVNSKIRTALQNAVKEYQRNSDARFWVGIGVNPETDQLDWMAERLEDKVEENEILEDESGEDSEDNSEEITA